MAASPGVLNAEKLFIKYNVISVPPMKVITSMQLL
jgi:hypothetical protein